MYPTNVFDIFISFFDLYYTNIIKAVTNLMTFYGENYNDIKLILVVSRIFYITEYFNTELARENIP